MKFTPTLTLALLLVSPSLISTFALHKHHAAESRLSHRHSFGPHIQNHYINTLPSDDTSNSLLDDANFFFTDKSKDSPKTIAVNYLAKLKNLDVSELKVRNAYQSKHNKVWHVYLVQMKNGIEIVNAVANVNIDSNGRVFSVGSSLYAPEQVKSKNQDNDFSSSNQVVLTNGVNLSSTKKNPIVSLDDPRIELSPADAVAALSRFLKIEDRSISDYSFYPVDSIRGETGGQQFLVSGAGFALNDIPAKLKYIQTEDGELKLIWDLEVEMENNWYHACVDTLDGSVHQLVDWTADASYRVYPLGTNDPEEGPRVLVHDPHVNIASPLGWHDQAGGKTFDVTVGNNVYAQENRDNRYEWENNRRPKSKELNFDFPLDLKLEPKTYEEAAVTNLFYWCNSIHDLFYLYGFDEAAGNFQHENFERGGRAQDPVIAHAQDGSGYNNANFATPPDGLSGRMRMYQWTETSPMRDGDLEGGIIMHEYAHGITTRLTGGPADSSCLGWGEAGGMGEGWGDFFATILRMDANTTRKDSFGMGEYSNGDEGIRRYKYSTSKKVNPSVYSYIQRPGYWGVHAKGEVWAEILFDVYWDMVEEHGYDLDWYNTRYEGIEPVFPRIPDSTSWVKRVKNEFRDFKNGKWKLHTQRHKTDKYAKQGGNVMMLQLVVDGLKMQPCKPSFVDARDAILMADKIAYGGQNYCLLYKAFARRGLGKDAESGGEDGFKVPKKCRE